MRIPRGIEGLGERVCAVSASAGERDTDDAVPFSVRNWVREAVQAGFGGERVRSVDGDAERFPCGARFPPDGRVGCGWGE